MNPTPTTEEHLMAALSHAGVIVSGPGILVGLLVWLTQREKSPYASRQGMQATVYQLLGFLVFMVLWFKWGIFYFLTFIPLIVNPNQYQDAPPPIFWVGIGAMIIPVGFMVIWILYGLWGAFRCLQGRDFRYAILGRMLQKGSKEG